METKKQNSALLHLWKILTSKGKKGKIKNGKKKKKKGGVKIGS